MSIPYKILAINPGSTSTKIAIFEGRKSVFLKNIKHLPETLVQFPKIADQYEFRKEVILNELIQSDVDIDDIVAVIGRGGLVKPIESGVYEVNEALKRDLHLGIQGEHASNLGGLIADDIAKTLKSARAFIADPVVVDELQEVARITGHPQMNRRSIFHALNQKAVAKNYAKTVGNSYESMNLIVAHMGGGISIGAHQQGKVTDVNNALDGFGPFSPERAGTLPSGALVDMCYDGRFTHDEMRKLINGRGGLMAHFGTNQVTEVEKLAREGNTKAALVLDAMAYQTSKAIGACAAVLCGRVDAVIITGGIANSSRIINYIKSMVAFLGPFVVYPGEDEMQALAENALAVLNGDVICKEYK